MTSPPRPLSLLPVCLLSSTLLLLSSSAASAGASNPVVVDTFRDQVLHVDHSLDEGATFSSRGPVVLHSGSGSGVVGRSANADQASAPLSPADLDQLRSLCRAHGHYLVRARVSPRGGDAAEAAPASSSSSYHRSVTDPCRLLAGGLRDVLTVHLDSKSQLVGVSLAPGAGQNATGAASAAPDHFETTVNLQQMEAGPAPDTSAFIQKMEQEKLQQQRGETKDNRSFFAKYWMYIIPVVLVLAMGSGNPEGGNGGGR